MSEIHLEQTGNTGCGALRKLSESARILISYLKSNGPRRLIAVAGIPGCGKTTFANEVADEVNGACGAGSMISLGMDGFHLTRAQLQQMPDPEAAFARRGSYWTFDVPALAARLQRVREGYGTEDVPWPDFQHEVGDPVEGGAVVPSSARIVLVEGLYLLFRSEGWESVSSLFDERWYLDIPLDVAMERISKRHQAAWGISKAAAQARIASNDILNAEVVSGTRALADRCFPLSF